MSWLKKADAGNPDRPCDACGTTDVFVSHVYVDEEPQDLCTKCCDASKAEGHELTMVAKNPQREFPEMDLPEKETEAAPKTPDERSQELYGKPYKALPDDGQEQDHIMTSKFDEKTEDAKEAGLFE